MLTLAFLNGDLKKEIYIEQPPTYRKPELNGMVYKPKKALYGFKHAPHA